MAEETFEGWAIIELMGHNRSAGYVREQVIAGAAFLRVDVPGCDGQTAYTRFYAPAAIYSIIPVSKDVAVAVAERGASPPVHAWDFPQLPAPEPLDPDVGDDLDGPDGTLGFRCLW